MKERLFYPATARNRDPILSILTRILPSKGRVLEVASGSGEHVVHFAAHFPDLIWQPSDLDPACLDSIQAWVEHSALNNVLPAVALDTTNAQNWPQERLDGMICINMVHISPWAATVGLMEKAGLLLKSGAPLYLYGPYKKNAQHTAPSNVEFEQWLKAKDPAFGVRDLEEVEALANQNALILREVIEMPANNFSLVFQRG